ncbi:endosome-associated-trafficking regulator 1-like [Hydra vulgaris]|uniref:Endosome-associated-trafficking regulator 1 n=1 Tax=Hydra vulgaris TaxID=6087 RepID=A0ABM4DKH8_HYDVU
MEDNPFSFTKFSQNKDPMEPTENDKIKNKSANEVSKSRKLVIVEDDGLTEVQNSVGEYLSTNTDEECVDRYVLPDVPDTDNYLMKQNKNLVTENIALKEDLLQTKKDFLEYKQIANKRIGALQRELDKVRNKEADETRALEDVVHIIEENLQSTTIRAVRAETTVACLRDEVNRLTEELNAKKFSLDDYDRLQKEHNELILTVKDRSQHVARLLRTAASKTEPHVRQLQSGIVSLNFLANQLDDIGKISDIIE